jgi:hypothetical protein
MFVLGTAGFLLPILSSFSLRFRDDKTLAVTVPSRVQIKNTLWKKRYKNKGIELKLPELKDFKVFLTIAIKASCSSCSCCLSTLFCCTAREAAILSLSMADSNAVASGLSASSFSTSRVSWSIRSWASSVSRTYRIKNQKSNHELFVVKLRDSSQLLWASLLSTSFTHGDYISSNLLLPTLFLRIISFASMKFEVFLGPRIDEVNVDS